ncbi:DEKNAAC100115 [Brettanomyces naardenensis]|uniref:ATP-dependent RNA helicase DBP9 n=1 Tax=Brettanomyces naardenensis TaxID=13370 RepID=A0A448YF61_BRENA|nr:DEKNAAC100115 [Brettanomyces naardenensis]
MSKIEVSKDYVDEDVSFESFHLDPRLIQAINKLGFEHPTLVQTQAIRLSLEEKKDIIARASTGSGKTAAYCIPVIQSILADSFTDNQIQAVILVPTKELAQQVYDFLNELTVYCGKAVKLLNLTDAIDDKLLVSLVNERPEVLISTPSKLVDILEKDHEISLTQLKYLVIDEVDLVASYGYSDDLDKLSGYLNLKQELQVFLMSATLNEDVDSLKRKFCSKPAILKLQDLEEDSKQLTQFYIRTNELDKFLLIYVILKLKLIKGKILVFVNDLDRGYRLKLYLQNFGIRSCILNSELPLNSRLHIVDQFNKNVYNLLIATDDSQELDEEPEKNSKDGKASKSSKSSEYGVSRGVDFRNVACVLNFDLPTSSKAYVHRVGRTARAGKYGMALSLVVNEKDWGKHRPSSIASAKRDEKVLARIENTQKKMGYELKPYQFDMKQMDGFRYRMDDAFRSVTKAAVRDARLREIKMELMTSEKLKRHFEENPEDLATLRHDKAVSKVRSDQNLKDVPDYLLPKAVRQDPKRVAFVPFNRGGGRKRRRVGGKKKLDPLKKFHR